MSTTSRKSSQSAEELARAKQMREKADLQYGAQLKKLVDDGKMTKSEAAEKWKDYKARQAASAALKEDPGHLGRGILLRRRAALKPAKVKLIDLLMWPITLLVWAFTAESWPWILAIAIRIGWWLMKEQGKDTAREEYEKKVPAAVRQSLSDSLSSSGWLWGGKFLLSLVVVLNMLQISGLFFLVSLILAVIWLRKPGKPRQLRDGGFILPRPWLHVVLGGYLSGLFHPENEVGPKGVKLGFKFGPIDKRTNFIPGKISQLDANDTVLGWILGSVDLTIKDSGGHTVTVKVARWLPTDKMEDSLRIKVGLQKPD